MNSITLIESAFSTFGLLVGQGSSKDEHIISIRIIWMTTLAFALIITNILLGSVTSLLSVKVEEIQIDSFRAAYENNFKLIYRPRSVFSEEYASNRSDPFLSKLNLHEGGNDEKIAGSGRLVNRSK